MDDTTKVLHRLKRRMGRERGRLDRWAADTSLTTQTRDRAYYEANQWSLAMGMLDEELRKIAKKEDGC